MLLILSNITNDVVVNIDNSIHTLIYKLNFMDKKYCIKKSFSNTTLITAGSTYLDIDAYACAVAMAELLQFHGENALAYSQAPCNYSVCGSLIKAGQVERELPRNFNADNAKYIIVDVSDPEFLKNSVSLEQVVAVYDHHVGFEAYWERRIGDSAHIEFIGAAATLIYREWKKAGLQHKMKDSTARLLIAAILDNTLNLTSSNTTAEDIEAFKELCQRTQVGEEFRASYFSEVQASVEADLKNALFNDIKTVRDNAVLPPRVAQISVWDAQSILMRLSEIRGWFEGSTESWMINVIDIKHHCSYFVCDDNYHQKGIEKIFDVYFESGVAKLPVPYLRKEIIKKTFNK